MEILHRPEAGVIFFRGSVLVRLWVFLLCTACMAVGQPAGGAASGGGSTDLPKPLQAVFDYLTMAGTKTASEFQPKSQSERNRAYLKSFINPVWYLKGGLSAAIDLKNDKPKEWEQGGSGYGKRLGNIMAQYTIQRTVTFGVSSLLHEDNRYFGSGKKGFWRRTGYALSSGILARHDNGKRYPSVSLIGGYATSAFVSRSWQPPSTRSAGDAAVSFGTSMGFSVMGSAIKEFLPDVVRSLKKHN